MLRRWLFPILFLSCSLFTRVEAQADSPELQPSGLPAALVAMGSHGATSVAIPPGQIASAVNALDGIIQEVMTRTGVPGLAMAVVHEDAVIYSKGFGLRRVGTDARVDENTVFQLASVSKPVGATVVAGVIGQGKLTWNTPVVDYLPGFKLADRYVTRQVTIGDLYSHRSGLPDHAGDWLEDLGYDRQTILRRLRFEPLAPFRVQHHYTNFGLTAAAQAVANAEGMAWEDLSQFVLYRPLGMTSTSSRYDDYLNEPNKAVLHVRIGDHWEARFTRQPDAQSPAGGVSSSATDMARWLRMELANGQFNGQEVINAKALQEARYPHIMSRPPDSSASHASFYGYGMGVGVDETGRVRFSHSGAFLLGAATTIMMLPSENLGLVVLTNGMPLGVPEAVAASFLDIVETGMVQRDWLATLGPVFAKFYENPSRLAGRKPPPNPVPARTDSTYVGVYDNRYHGPARVRTREGGLVLELGPERRQYPLQHWSGDTFAYYPTGENAVGISAVDFKGTGARAGRVVIENLDENQQGTFTRR